jgi:uncharacterized protein (TIGR02246 family)
MSEQINAAPEPHDLRPQIASIVDKWIDAWNAHDAAALACLVASDIDFINVGGRWLQGAEEFLHWHRQIHLAHLRQSRWLMRRYRTKVLNDSLALVHLEWTIEGELTLDGSLKSSRSGIFTWLVAPRDGSWRIIAAHNTNLAEGSVHRLTTASS